MKYTGRSIECFQHWHDFLRSVLKEQNRKITKKERMQYHL